MQDTNSSFMHFDIAEQMVWLSERMTLRPGDVIATGTGSGVGRPRGIFLKEGDEVTIEMDGLGVADVRDLGPGEDIVLSFSGAKQPMCHDVGPFDVCPTFEKEGIAVWKRDGFSARRLDLFCWIYALITGRIIAIQ